MKDKEIELAVLASIEQMQNQRDLAQSIGYSLGKVNYVLKALVDKGFIKIENFTNSDKKSQYKYLLTQDGIKQKISLTQNFIKRKKSEYDELQKNLEQYNEKYSHIIDDFNVGGVNL